jgi:hypothetical protein
MSLGRPFDKLRAGNGLVEIWGAEVYNQIFVRVLGEGDDAV